VKVAAEVRYIGHKMAGEDATLLVFEVPPFGEAAADLFAQTQLWDDGPRPEETAFELLGAALDDVGMRRAESDRYDPNFLRRISSYGRMFRKGGLRRIVLPDSVAARSPALDATVVETAHALSAETPKPRRVRISGRLDLIGASQGVLKVHVPDGGVVTALWEGKEPMEQIVALFNRDVLCEGLAVFRPSGTLLRVDVDAMAAASQRDAAFAHVPRAAPLADVQRSLRVRPTEVPAYRTFLGSVPKQESDEEFAAAVEALS
jgi:hypothetical protein